MFCGSPAPGPNSKKPGGAGRGRGSLTAAAARYSIDGWVTPCELADFAEREKGRCRLLPRSLTVVVGGYSIQTPIMRISNVSGDSEN